MDIDVVKLREMILDELEPRLADRCRTMEETMTAAVMKLQDRHHSENRYRLQGIDDHASKGVELATHAVAQNELLREQQGDLASAFRRVEQSVSDVLMEIRTAKSMSDGEAKATKKQAEQRGKLVKILQYIVGILGSAGLGKWIMEQWHKP